MEKLIPRDFDKDIASNHPAPFYSFALDLVNKCVDCPKFPMIPNKILYHYWLVKVPVTVEEKYPLFHWKSVWSNFHDCKFISLFDKEIIYKYLHNVLMVKQRLYTFKLSESSLCELCKEEESAIHLFYFCMRSRPVFDWLLEQIETICQFKPKENIRFLYFDIDCKDLHVKNICILFLCSYIISIWSCRNIEEIAHGIIKRKVSWKCMQFKKELRLLFDNPMTVNNIFGDFLDKVSF